MWLPHVYLGGGTLNTERLTIYFSNLSLGSNWVATAWTNGKYSVSSFLKNGVEQLVWKEVNYLKVSELISAMVSSCSYKSLPTSKFTFLCTRFSVDSFVSQDHWKSAIMQWKCCIHLDRRIWQIAPPFLGESFPYCLLRSNSMYAGPI